VGGDGLQAAEGRDVPAHVDDGTRVTLAAVAGYAVTANLATVTLRVEPLASR
jgi:hypothetical protein